MVNQQNNQFKFFTSLFLKSMNKIREYRAISLFIEHGKSVFKKVNTLRAIDIIYFSAYHMIFYHIWCPPIQLQVCIVVAHAIVVVINFQHCYEFYNFNQKKL